MPSKPNQYKTLLLKVLVVVLWIPLTGSISHGRTYGDLKRLSALEFLVLLLPLCVFLLVGSYLVYVVPSGVVQLAGGVALVTIALTVSLYSLTLVSTAVLDWRLSRKTFEED